MKAAGNTFMLMHKVVLGLSATLMLSAIPAFANDLTPEITSEVFEENEQECATVSINGKELLSYKGETIKGSAEDRAEDLASRLEELFDDDDKQINPDSILPAKEGDMACVRIDGTVLKFDLPTSIDGEAAPQSPQDTSLKICNMLREALGGSQLPSNFFKAPEAVDPENVATTGEKFSGHASWYGGKFHGRRTSAGERFDQDSLTAAHRSLPFGTKLLVMNRRTGDKCVVKVNDRGPFVHDRVIDVSRGAARQLNMISSGVAMVDVFILENQ